MKTELLARIQLLDLEIIEARMFGKRAKHADGRLAAAKREKELQIEIEATQAEIEALNEESSCLEMAGAAA